MACSCTCAPGPLAEKPRLEKLGGKWLGCCGDPNHTYGFHLPSCACAPDDYSLRYGVGNPNWACAIDVGMGWEGSREWLAKLINKVRTEQDPDYRPLVEIIGSLDGINVIYLARWNGWKIEKYTGQGHDTWTHLGYDRTLAEKDLHLLDGELMTHPLPPVQAQQLHAITVRVEKQAAGIETYDVSWTPSTTDKETNKTTQKINKMAEQVDRIALKIEVLDDQLATIQADLAKVISLLENGQSGTVLTYPANVSITYADTEG